MHKLEPRITIPRRFHLWSRARRRGHAGSATRITILTSAAWLLTSALLAQGGGVAQTLHNLSVTGPGEIRSTTERQICKFCHIPHNAVVPQPLWGHQLSKAKYILPEISDGAKSRRPAPQPDGASRLCLSCHDGTVALGDLGSGPQEIEMRGASRLTPGRRGFLGTDLSGSHPISFKLSDSPTRQAAEESDMGIQSLAVVVQDPDVKLDAENKMQCTTCHDPHNDRYYKPDEVPRFWVKPTYEEVCLTCHMLR